MLIPKCSKVRWWNIYKKYKYTNQLVGLESSLQSLYNILNVQAARDSKETLVKVIDIETVVDRTDVTSSQVESDVRIIKTMVQQIAENGVVHNQKTDPVHGWGAVPVGAPFTVGVDEPLRELKIKLLKDEKVSMLVLTALGGCGKTTLAIKFCEDYEVKGTPVSVFSPLIGEVFILANKLFTLVVIQNFTSFYLYWWTG